MKNKTPMPLLLKVVIVGVVALLMLIPLELVKDTIFERESLLNSSISDIESSWSNPQCLTGPYLNYTYKQQETKDDKQIMVEKQEVVYPKNLIFDIDAHTQTLHRSIYDVTVYTATVHINGEIIPATHLKGVKPELMLMLDDLRGIVGEAYITINDNTYEFVASSEKEHCITTQLDESTLQTNEAGKALTFDMTFELKGSEEMNFRPVGNMTTVNMHSDCADPSFIGDFLPVDREVNENGFTAKWLVSQINRGAPESTMFGVKMLQPVTQYRETTRAAKYGLLLIALVFLAGFIVEFVTKKGINILQYIVIGLSMALFYALLLSFSEFMSFALSYLLAALMTTIALTGYFRGILKDKVAYVLGGGVGIAYLASYILMQMQTYSLLTGSLMLFVCLCIVMYYTRNQISLANTTESPEKAETKGDNTDSAHQEQKL